MAFAGGNRSENLSSIRVPFRVSLDAATVQEADFVVERLDAGFAVVEVLDSTDAENRILRPALEGTRVALESAAKAGSVRRFVVLSSVAAVHSVLGMPDSHVFTEADWNSWLTLASDQP